MWQVWRRSVPRAVAVGLFVGIFLMVPGLQIVGAALASVPFRANIPIAAAIVRFATAVDEAATVEDVYRAAVDAVSVSMESPFVMLMARRGDETRCVAASEAMPVEAIDVFHAMNIGALLPLHTQPVLLRDEQNSRSTHRGP